jgi:hypothetical protein
MEARRQLRLSGSFQRVERRLWIASVAAASELSASLYFSGAELAGKGLHAGVADGDLTLAQFQSSSSASAGAYPSASNHTARMQTCARHSSALRASANHLLPAPAPSPSFAHCVPPAPLSPAAPSHFLLAGEASAAPGADGVRGTAARGGKGMPMSGRGEQHRAQSMRLPPPGGVGAVVLQRAVCSMLSLMASDLSALTLPFSGAKNKDKPKNGAKELAPITIYDKARKGAAANAKRKAAHMKAQFAFAGKGNPKGWKESPVYWASMGASGYLKK